MKPITAKVTSITQGEQAGTIQLKSQEKGTQPKYIIMVQCSDINEVRELDHGKEYTITFTPKK